MHELTATVLDADPKFTFRCQCCDKVLKNHGSIEWVELTEEGAMYKLTSTIPDTERSQGCFPMGRGCYRAAKPL